MMWALGSGGSSSSSSSNLSPLAPPFTVDRFNNSRPITNPHLNDSHYSLPSSQSWQYTPHISASRSGFLSEDSMKTTSVPLANETSISQSADPSSSYWPTRTFGADTSIDEFSYISEGRPYYLPYASPVVSNNTPFLPINESTPDVVPTSGVQPGSVSSQVDYTQSLAGLHYSHSSGVWNGLAHKKLGKKMEGNVNLSFDNATTSGSNHFKSPINQGAHVLERRPETQDDSGTYCGNFIERETHEGFLRMGQMKDKCQKTYNAYEKCIQPHDSHTCNNIPPPKSSTTVVIRPPAPAAVQVSSTKRAPSFRTGQGGKFAAVQMDGLCSPPDPFKGEEPHQPLSSIGKGMYLGSKQLNVPTDDDDHNICNASSWPLKESLVVQSHVNDTLKQTFESCSGSNATFTKGLDDMYLASDGVQVVRYNEGNQDGLDHHNPNVDSPCWKGTLASRTSPFDVEHMHPPQGNHHFPSEVFSGATSNMLYDSNVVHNENGSALDGKTIPLKGLLIENCPAKDHLSTDAGKVEPESQTQDSRDPSNCRTSNFCDSVDSVLNINDVSQGCNVALDAAEKVLHSPSSQEDLELAHRHGRLSYPKLDVQTLVMAIHNLSELLRFHCSNDEPTFREADHQALNYTINNLNACIPKKIGTMNATQDKILGGQNFVDGNMEGFHTDTGLTLPQIKIKPASCLLGQPTIQHMHGCEVRNEDLKPFLSISNPIIPKEDIMSQAIGKVLQENFEFDGEMESQALIFKNLWLEAEAKLCSLSYKARFDHMKIAMNMQNTTRAVDENVASAEKISGFSGVSNIDADVCSLRKPCIQSQSISRSAHDILGGKGSVTSRYNILKYREENSSMYVDKERDSDMIRTGFAGERSNRSPHIEHAATVENISSLQPSPSNCDAESSVMARLNILRGRDSYLGEEQFEPMQVKMLEEKIRNAGMAPPFLHHPSGMVHEIGSFAAAGKESTKAFQFSAAIDPVQQTSMHNRASMGASTLHNTSSSDWEHVLKDDFVAWHG